jgi:hypothetical protein
MLEVGVGVKWGASERVRAFTFPLFAGLGREERIKVEAPLRRG